MATQLQAEGLANFSAYLRFPLQQRTVASNQGDGRIRMLVAATDLSRALVSSSSLTGIHREDLSAWQSTALRIHKLKLGKEAPPERQD